MRQSMLTPLTPLIRFTHSVQTSSRPLLGLRTISTLESNFSTRAQQFDEVVGAAKSAGLAKVEIAMYVLDMWKEERAQLLAGQFRIMAEKEESAVKSAVAITKLKMNSLTLLEDKLRLEGSFNVRGGLGVNHLPGND